MIMITKAQQKVLIVFFIITLIAIAFSGCTEPSISPTPQPTVDIEEQNLPPLLNATALESILPDYLPGEWEYLQNYTSQGTITMIVTKPGNHRSVITIQDKRTAQLAKYAVTPQNFSYTHSSIIWEWSETRFYNAPAINGKNIENGIFKGELIAYPNDRFLVIAYIVGENDEIVDMLDLLDSLEFP